MIEIERTFLVKFLPEDLDKFPKVEIYDKYFPLDAVHPKIRLRKKGNEFTLTKKEPVDDDKTKSIQEEQVIILTEAEFDSFDSFEGKELSKFRYNYSYKNLTAEIDIYTSKLKGLAVVDFEFQNEAEKESFEMPDFCLADVTEDEFIAAGILAGKSYEDIEDALKRYKYKRV